MMKLFRNRYKKTSPARPGKWTGQGMVEFALALPILLLVVYGLLESGRLLFIYSSTVTAARQAARYGSATGNNDGGTPYYRDCAGIRDAAQNVGFLNTFADGDITITYDRGLDNGGSVVAIPGVSADPATDTCSAMNDSTLELGDRIKVQVSTVWTPIIAIVPSWQGFTITSAAERTILTEVAIGITPSGGTWGGPTGTLTLSLSSPTTSYDEVGDVISYTYTLTNSSASSSVSGPFTVTDNKATTDCSAAAGTLAPGASTTCTGTYTVTQADLDAGSVTNTATAAGTGATSGPASLTIYAIQNPEVAMLNITPDPDVASTAGTVITYTYLFQNSGNVTLTGPYTISDNTVLAGNISCSGAADPLAPGATTECTGTYALSGTDIASGSVTNTASVTAFFNGVETAPSNSDSATVITSPLSLTIVPPASITIVGPVQYTYTLKNISSSTLNNPQVSDNRVSGISCPGSIAPGATVQCTGTYTITQAMIDAGTPITNQATATANGGVTSNQANASVSITQSPVISLTASTSTSLATVAGTSITYSYIITNTGNVTLSAPFIISNPGLTGTPTCTIASGSIAPLGTIPCSITYSVQSSDLAAGSIINTASASVTHNGNNYSATANTTTVITHNAPRVTLEIISSVASFANTSTPITFTFKLHNTGNSNLATPFSVSVTTVTNLNPSSMTVSCPQMPNPLPIGQSIPCTTLTASYTPLANSNVIVRGTGTAGGTTSALAEKIIPYSLDCTITASILDFPGLTVGNSSAENMQTSLTNYSASGSVTIASIQLASWNNGGERLRRIYLGPTLIWSGNTNAATVNITSFSATPTLPNDGSPRVLLFEFNNDYTVTGTETVTLTFTPAGCPTLVITD